MDQRAAFISWFLGIGCLSFAVTGCTNNATASTTPTPVATIPPQLRPMLDFPVHSSPRPIVLLLGPVNFDTAGPNGQPVTFPDDDSRLAYSTGAIDPPSHFPDGPAEAHGYPIMSGIDAFGLLTARSKGSSPSPLTSRLRVTSVSLGSAKFYTDRGYLTLPAWLFFISKSTTPTPVLAVAPPGQWTPSDVRTNLSTFLPEGVAIGADQRTLTVSLIGSPARTGPCTADYTLAATEYPAVVTLRVVEHVHGGNRETCLAAGELRSVSTLLHSPIGNRLLVRTPTGRVLVASREAECEPCLIWYPTSHGW